MSGADPFADYGDTESTIVRPSPGGRRAAERMRAAQPATPPLPRHPGINPLVTEASPLLALINRIRNTARHANVEELRRQLIDEIKQFTRRAIAAGIEPRVVGAGQYALCATVDDVVLNTPWGGASNWSKRGMVTTFHREAWGGDRFYTLLDHMQRDTKRNFAALELMYLCLALGFEGRLRVLPNGAAELTRIRDALHRLIRRRRGEYESELSPHWEGVTASRSGSRAPVPLWVAILISIALLVAGFWIFSLILGEESDPTFRSIVQLEPRDDVTLVRPEPPAAPVSPTPAVPDTPPPPTTLQTLQQFLAPEIAANQVEVFGDDRKVTIRIGTDGMFGTGSARVANDDDPIWKRIADALGTVQGNILVVGHTDSVPIRTIQFPSNFELSQARATSVVDILAEYMDPTRLSAEGRADADPVVENATTPADLAKNRRVDIEVVAPR